METVAWVILEHFLPLWEISLNSNKGLEIKYLIWRGSWDICPNLQIVHIYDWCVAFTRAENACRKCHAKAKQDWSRDSGVTYSTTVSPKPSYTEDEFVRNYVLLKVFFCFLISFLGIIAWIVPITITQYLSFMHLTCSDDWWCSFSLIRGLIRTCHLLFSRSTYTARDTNVIILKLDSHRECKLNCRVYPSNLTYK